MSTKDKYTRVRGAEEKHDEKLDTDILMRFSDRYGKYVSRALTLFFGEGKPFVTIKAAERLIDKALWVGQVVRRKVPNLHQIIAITEQTTVDIYEPTEEGLLPVRDERILTVVEITLTLSPTPLQLKLPGYHKPLAPTEGHFLTKLTWEANERERAKAREDNAEHRERGENRERGEQRTRAIRRE